MEFLVASAGPGTDVSRKPPLYRQTNRKVGSMMVKDEQGPGERRLALVIRLAAVALWFARQR